MIPNIFHFVFGLKPQVEPFHLMHYLCLASCIEVNSPDVVYFHHYHEPYGPWWDRIRPKLTLRRIEPDAVIAAHTYENPDVAKFRYAHLADFTRLEVLLAEGGIYADMDTLFLRPLPADWLTRQFILGRERPPPHASRGSLCNAWIASAPGAAFGRIWLDAMRSSFDGSWSDHSTVLPYTLAEQNPGLLNVEPETAFFSLDWSPKGIADLFERAVSLPEEAYSLHLWHHLWGDRRRRDFTSFHDGLLTPDYVRCANTTYANHARRFLPDDCSGSHLRYATQQLKESIAAPLRSLAERLGRIGS